MIYSQNNWVLAMGKGELLMWTYNKVLEYPVNIRNANPRAGKMYNIPVWWTRWRTEFIAKLYKFGMVTICGHTPVETIKILPWDDSKIYFGDTHSLYSDLTNIGDKYYLLINTDEPKNEQIKIIY